MKKKILLVDDEETLRWALHEALSEEGFDIENTNDSVKALAFTRKTKYDLVISDLKMPIMSGLQLISEIKKQNPDTKAIIITAYGSEKAISSDDNSLSNFGFTAEAGLNTAKNMVRKL